MTTAQYARLSAPFRPEKRRRALLAANRVLTYGCYAAYPLLLAALAVQRDGHFWRALLVPGISVVLLSLVRRLINAPRPYEALDIAPLIHKDTHGKSLPSRHVFSMFVIAMTFLWLLPPVGILLLICGAVLAAVRVIGGVHYPRDVIVGAAVGVLAGIIGFWII